MSGSKALALEIPVTLERQPRDDELALFGLTHPGMVCPENQDQYLVCTVHPQLVMHGTSLPDPDRLPVRGERVATILLVADGVGGGDRGREASELATRAVTRYVMSSLRCYHLEGSSTDANFFGALRDAALDAHEAVRIEAADRPSVNSMATTLTLAILVWPAAYVVQVRDSRCHHFSNGEQQQVTKDQTRAQALAEVGALAPSQIRGSKLNHILTSPLGGAEALPVVTRVETRRDSVRERLSRSVALW